jgi:glucokinase
VTAAPPGPRRGQARTPLHVLAGDVGGSKTILALVRVGADGERELVSERSFPSREHPGLEHILREFRRGHAGEVAAAAFGIAGPVLDGRVTVTNLPWHVDAKALADAIGCPRVALHNDLETTAYGALFLDPDQILTLNPGVPRRAHRAVIAAGTGLGQAILFWDGTRHRPAATEGGHAAFAPRSERELALLRFLLARYGRVSWERVLSGPGLLRIFEFLRDALDAPVAPHVRERMQTEDPSAVIGESGVAGSCRTCEQAVDMFVSLYGAQAANLALTTLALGGIYVGGGIVTKLLPKVTGGGFMASFRDVGRFAELLAQVPVRIILDPKTSLAGATELAIELAGGSPRPPSA